MRTYADRLNVQPTLHVCVCVCVCVCVYVCVCVGGCCWWMYARLLKSMTVTNSMPSSLNISNDDNVGCVYM